MAQSCPTLCDPMDCRPPGSSIRGILQAGVLEWAAISKKHKDSASREEGKCHRRVTPNLHGPRQTWSATRTKGNSMAPQGCTSGKNERTCTLSQTVQTKRIFKNVGRKLPHTKRITLTYCFILLWNIIALQCVRFCCTGA